MRANTETLLSLKEYTEIMGIDPYEFAQIGEGRTKHTDQKCKTVFFQRPWHDDHLSRDEIADAIREAEHMIAEELGYWPAPKYVEGESLRYPRPANRIWYGDGMDVRWQWKSVQFNWMYVHGGGKMTRTLIEAGVGITYTDFEGDNVKDEFSLTVNTTVTDPDEIAIYFTSADRSGKTLDETWRIRPIEVSISGGVATIKGHITQVVLPSLQDGTKPDKLTISAAIFAFDVDVYRVYRDTTATDTTPNQGNAEWDEVPSPTPTGSVETKAITLLPYDATLGIVKVQIPSTWPQEREPDKLTVNYLAGISRINGRMNRDFAYIVARLATTLLASNACGCERSSRIISYWREWPSDANERARPLTPDEINKRFGATRGGRYAREHIERLRLKA